MVERVASCVMESPEALHDGRERSSFGFAAGWLNEGAHDEQQVMIIIFLLIS